MNVYHPEWKHKLHEDINWKRIRVKTMWNSQKIVEMFRGFLAISHVFLHWSSKTRWNLCSIILCYLVKMEYIIICYAIVCRIKSNCLKNSIHWMHLCIQIGSIWMEFQCVQFTHNYICVFISVGKPSKPYSIVFIIFFCSLFPERSEYIEMNEYRKWYEYVYIGEEHLRVYSLNMCTQSNELNEINIVPM